MSKEIEEFYQLFDIAPNLNIVEINNNNFITEILDELATKCDGRVTTVDFTALEKQKAKIKKDAYEYGVISSCFFENDDSKSLLSLISKGVRDSGYIIIIEEKGKELKDIYSLFEQFDIGAANKIDIFEKYDLIMGKKLHMWGM